MKNMANKIINVLIVDDEQIVREGLRYIIDWNTLGFCICGEAANGEDALEMIRQHVVARSLEIAKAVEKIKEVNYELADMGLEQVPVPTIEDKPGLSALGASDIRTVNDSLARFDASVEHFKQTALEAEKKLRKARAGQSAARADALLNEWLSDDPASLIQVAEGAGELLQELLNGLKKRQYAGAAFLLCVDSSSLLLGAYCGKDAIADGLSAGDMIREVSALAGGKGGGRPDQARGSAPQDADPQALAAAARNIING